MTRRAVLRLVCLFLAGTVFLAFMLEADLQHDEEYRVSSEAHYSSIIHNDTAARISVEPERISPEHWYYLSGEPILLWWTEFSKENVSKQCGNVRCFVTFDRHFFRHPDLQGLIFYGTGFDPYDLPWPRLPQHEWALLHEESPHNNYLMSHAPIMELFNHSATFKRHSDFPLTTFWLKDIESLETSKYLVPVEEKNALLHTEGLALVAYVHSDCGCYSNRDHFVQMLMQHIKVDCMGKCLHNKDLPEHLRSNIHHMEHEDFLKILARYKFVILAENNICDDYITEKFWRPFVVGSVPIVIASEASRDFLPHPRSAIYVSDYHNMSDLVQDILRINSSSQEYNSYLTFKQSGVQNDLLRKILSEREWGIHNDPRKPNFIQSFECLLCQRIHLNNARLAQGLPVVAHRVTVDHYGCPAPRPFKGTLPNDIDRVVDSRFDWVWRQSGYEAQVLNELWAAEQFNISKEYVKERVNVLNEKDTQHR